MLGLRCIAEENNMSADLFQHNTYIESNQFILSTSQVGIIRFYLLYINNITQLHRIRGSGWQICHWIR